MHMMQTVLIRLKMRHYKVCQQSYASAHLWATFGGLLFGVVELAIPLIAISATPMGVQRHQIKL